LNSDESVRVVNDQQGQPTSAFDLAELTVNAVTKNVSSGVFHVVTHAFFKACLFLGAGSGL
jgi:dTDP-4-dehydrorhamnose reductase